MKFKKGNLEKQVSKVPRKVVWCKNCVISNQRPRIIFDDDQICSGCKNNKLKEKINWDERENELHKLLDKHRSKNGSWDVIVPSSGGKDSGYVAHQLKYKYGMNPLTVTWSPLEYTDIGWKNLRGKIKSGFNNFLYSPNGLLQRKLARLSFEELGDAFHVFVLGQVSFPFHIAKLFNISLVFYGENGELEYAGDPKYVDKPYKPSSEFLEHHFKGAKFEDLIDYGLSNKYYLSKEDLFNGDLNFYKPPSEVELNNSGIEGKYYFSYYKKWIPQENFYYCVKNTNFKPNLIRSEGTYSKYASLDDQMDGFHYYMRYIKFGLGRCVEDAAHEIRDGHISRQEGIQLMQKYEGEFPSRYFKEFLNYLNITEEHFFNVVDEWRAEHLWKKKGNDWTLKNPIR